MGELPQIQVAFDSFRGKSISITDIFLLRSRMIEMLKTEEQCWSQDYYKAWEKKLQHIYRSLHKKLQANNQKI